MRLKFIKLAWFRGAADPVLLEPNCKSMVVYGENGSGKSSFVDAVEYVLNSGSIEHLKTEYSGSRQLNAIPNTHKSETSKTALSFKFKDDSELKIDFKPNGSSQSSGAQGIAMEEWEYRQTVLRQNEVSEFIHNTKGKKYSALLPLFGLDKMEVAAGNLRRLAKSVETEARLNDKKANLKQVRDQWQSAFGTQNYDQIVKRVDNLYKQYHKDNPTTREALSRCNELETAIDNRIKEYSAEDRIHVSLKEVAALNLKDHVDAVRTSSVKLAGSLDPHIAEKLAALQAAGVFVGGLKDSEIVECPACGQTITMDAFREHVETERERLQEVNDTFNAYKAAIGTVCDTLNALKANLDKPDLKSWRNGLVGTATVDGFKYLERMSPNTLRGSCSDDDLNAIESMLPIIAAAKLVSKDAPPNIQKLTADKKLLDTAKSVITTKDLESEIASGEALVTLINSVEQGIRLEIRQRSQSVIDSISEDIESMWETLHPGERIDNVRLSLPTDTDKAIDVVLKFHGLEQEISSPHTFGRV